MGSAKPMNTYDTLTYNGTERTLAKWGFALDGCIQKRGNAKPDTFRGTIPTASILIDPIFPYKAAVVIQTNRQSATGADNSFTGGVIKFQGKRVANPAKAKAGSQGVTFQFEGPWFDLSITQYTQSFKGQTTNYNPGEVVLNTASAPLITTAGIRFISWGDQAQSILQYVLDQYAAQGLPAPFQYVGRALLNGAINLDTTGNTGGETNENTDEEGNIYNQKLQANSTIDPALFQHFLKSEIVRPMAAAECLEKLLESSPRTNIAFDYSTPTPTCHIQNVDNAPPVSVPLFDGVSNKEIDIQRRDDLVPAAVLVGYRITASSNGSQVVDYVIDKWGPNGYNSPLDPSAGPGVLIYTLDLTGSNVNYTTASMDCEPLACIGGTQATKRAWWVSKRGAEAQKLADSRIRFQMPDPANPQNVLLTTIPDSKIFYASNGFDSTGAPVVKDQEFTAADYAFYTNRIVSGTYHTFMTLANGAKVLAVKARISASMTYAAYNALSPAPTQPATNSNPDLDTSGSRLTQYNNFDQHVSTITLTNAANVGGQKFTSTTISSFTPGESFILGPGGISQYLFTMLSVLQYEGEYVKIEAIFANNVSMLNRLNLTGGRAEWTVMNAQIQDIEEDWGTKETRVRVGVSKHLNAEQLSAFLNAWRTRRAWYNPALRGDNTEGSASNVDMPQETGHSNTTEGLQDLSKVTILNYSTQPSGTNPGVISSGIILDPKHMEFIDAMNAQ
jgi:hypothetical protein